MTAVRRLSIVLSLAALLGLSACGSEQEAVDPEGVGAENAQVAETEGIYLDVDEMKYQVQLSRQLNPLINADKALLQDVARFDSKLQQDEVWFAIWMRVENPTGKARPTVSQFTIRDTQENIYRPVTIGPTNVFAYHSTSVPAEKVYPLADTPAAERQPFGALLLFKVRRFSLDNRPLTLELVGPETQQKAIVNLDV